MLPAVRKGDSFVCPSHVGGVIEGPCCYHVRIGGAEAARAGDCGHCGASGTLDSIKIGNPTVLIAGEPAAGMTQSMAHGGLVTTGCLNVYIGQPIVDANGNLVPVPKECDFVWRRNAPWPSNLDRFRSPAAVRATGKHPGAHKVPLAPWGEPRYVTSRTYVVTVRGRQITLYVAVGSSEEDFDEARRQQIIAALGALSDEQLDAVKEIYLNPVLNPDDEIWKRLYQNPNHVSAAATGGGRIYIFPTGVYGDQGRWDRLLQHEAAHAVWQDRPEVHARWKDAIQKDRRTVTSYGNSATPEDFAEAVLMYSLVKGTPCEAAMRAAFPARFALLEDIFRGGYSKPQMGKVL